VIFHTQGETLVIKLLTFFFIPFPASSIRRERGEGEREGEGRREGRLLVSCPTDCVLTWSGMTLEYIKKVKNGGR